MAGGRWASNRGTASEDESSEETVSNVEDLQTDIVETPISSERPDDHKNLNNAGALTSTQKTPTQSPASLSLTKTAGPSRATTSCASISCRALLCSVHSTAPKIHLRWK